jgi:hypothetical protein
MTTYDFIMATWPAQAQRIISATRAIPGGDGVLTKDVPQHETPEQVLRCLFIWSGTPEGHGYWRDLAEGRVRV